jgi:hypothetical protein
MLADAARHRASLLTGRSRPSIAAIQTQDRAQLSHVANGSVGHPRVRVHPGLARDSIARFCLALNRFVSVRVALSRPGTGRASTPRGASEPSSGVSSASYWASIEPHSESSGDVAVGTSSFRHQGRVGTRRAPASAERDHSHPNRACLEGERPVPARGETGVSARNRGSPAHGGARRVEVDGAINP